ncbi:MAG TPA: RHS repeat-associated core domain-containing protein, partial [Cytophagaceae bacterium]
GTKEIEFRYDAQGNRVAKIAKAIYMEQNSSAWEHTFYVRDASGNVMATYQRTGTDLKLVDQTIYGSSRLGLHKRDIPLVGVPDPTTYSLYINQKYYELGDHRGNVNTTVSDFRVGVGGTNNANLIDHYAAVIKTTADYGVWGDELVGRGGKQNDFRFGFNGKEKDDDGEFGKTVYDYGFRIYNPGLGRFLSMDPLSKNYQFLSPYQFAENTPIFAIDLDGLEAVPNYGSYSYGKVGTQMASSESVTWQKATIQTGKLGAIVVTGVLAPGIGSAAYARLATYFMANPQAAMGMAGTVAAFFDENPAQNWPGVGDDFVKGLKVLFKTGSKQTSFIAQTGAKFANTFEKSWAKKLLGEGKDVTLLKESVEEGIRTPDFIVDGVKTELKAISNVTNPTSDKLSNAISQTIKESSGQAGNLIIDLTEQTGATLDIAKRGVGRYFGQGNSKELIRVVGEGFDQIFKRNDFIKK